VSKTDTLRSLEIVLESFLERAVARKQDRLRVLDGINRLDDLARGMQGADVDRQVGLTDRIGEWFAEHRNWVQDPRLRPAERNRIGRILDEIRESMEAKGHATPATQKISSEIERWQRSVAASASSAIEGASSRGQRLVLRRGPETSEPAETSEPQPDSIVQFYDVLRRITNRFRDSVRDSRHIMSILDDSLTAAVSQRNHDALMLSALIIYHLKQHGYLVGPFVKRLKEAERLHRQEAQRA